jgi:nucleotidyltransferase substrate binding protein (TIGR01987 family)
LAQAEKENLDNVFIQGGIIDKFYIQFELSWKLLKELLRYEGIPESASGSPREILKAAYACYDFIDEKIWLDMLRDRNDTTHIYDSQKAQRLVKNVLDTYIPVFQELRKHIEARYTDELDQLK